LTYEQQRSGMLRLRSATRVSVAFFAIASKGPRRGEYLIADATLVLNWHILEVLAGYSLRPPLGYFRPRMRAASISHF
jgi:hypothetical protein